MGGGGSPKSVKKEELGKPGRSGRAEFNLRFFRRETAIATAHHVCLLSAESPQLCAHNAVTRGQGDLCQPPQPSLPLLPIGVAGVPASPVSCRNSSIPIPMPLIPTPQTSEPGTHPPPPQTLLNGNAIPLCLLGARPRRRFLAVYNPLPSLFECRQRRNLF